MVEIVIFSVFTGLQEKEIKECFTNVKEVFLLYLWVSLVTLELISLIPLVGSPRREPPSCGAPYNQLFMNVPQATIQDLQIY